MFIHTCIIWSVLTRINDIFIDFTYKFYKHLLDSVVIIVVFQTVTVPIGIFDRPIRILPPYTGGVDNPAIQHG